MISRPVREASAVSADGTTVSYLSVGEGHGLVLVGGALSSASTYVPLAEALAGKPHSPRHESTRPAAQRPPTTGTQHR